MRLQKLVGLKKLSRHYQRATFMQLDEEVLHISDSAKKRLATITKKDLELSPDSLIRVVVDSGGCKGYQIKFELDSASQLAEDDHAYSCVVTNTTAGNATEPAPRPRLAIDKLSLQLLSGATIDFVNEIARQSFVVADNPQAASSCGCKISFSKE
jgi:iron-sulfur cluster assembly accessory protein